MKDLAVNERPQERLERLGPRSLSDRELMAMLLRSGSRDRNVLAVASDIVQQAGSLSGLLSWSAEDYQRVHGVGKVKALQLVTVVEIARRILTEGAEQSVQISGAADVYRYFRHRVSGERVEKFFVCCLNRRNRLLRAVEVTSGTVDSSLVHPREVYRESIRLSASTIIVAHNHPSGDPSPSAADIRVTRQLCEAGRALHIPCLDHVILGDESVDPHGLGYYSFSDSGLIGD